MAEQAVSPAIKAKARRLLSEQRVLIGIAGYVRGDTDDYVVAIRDGKPYCGCPARVRWCAHAVAVATILKKAKEA